MRCQNLGEDLGLLKILFSHEWVTLGIALFKTRSWAITSVSGKA